MLYTEQLLVDLDHTCNVGWATGALLLGGGERVTVREGWEKEACIDREPITPTRPQIGHREGEEEGRGRHLHTQPL